MISYPRARHGIGAIVRIVSSLQKTARFSLSAFFAQTTRRVSSTRVVPTSVLSAGPPRPAGRLTLAARIPSSQRLSGFAEGASRQLHGQGRQAGVPPCPGCRLSHTVTGWASCPARVGGRCQLLPVEIVILQNVL